MKKNYLYIFFVFLAFYLPVNAQVAHSKTCNGNNGAPQYKINWTVDPFDQKVFIENQGQFTSDLPAEYKILYGAQVGDVYAFITSNGDIIYKYTEHASVHVKADGTREAVDPDEVDWSAKPKEDYLTAEWQGSTSNVTTVAGEEQSNYYTYPLATKGNMRANIFRKVTCMNVYPGIDIEYMFPKDGGGIKYTLVVHPGANLSLIKLKYTGAEKMFMGNDGNVTIKTGWGEFTDHAPISFYSEDNNKTTSNYILDNDEETFAVNNSDATKTLMIDPTTTNWTENPPFSTSGYDGAYDVDFDYAGNVYVYGGYDPFKLIKYTSAGVQQWTYNTTNFADELYGDFCVDKASGISFCLQGFGGGGNAITDKISPAGALMSTFPPAGTSSLDEQWRASYDLCDHIILVAGGGTNAALQAETMDTNLSSATITNVLGAGTALHDFSLIGTDPLLPQGYMATARGVVYPTVDDNTLIQLPLPGMTPVAYNVPDNYSFVEVGSVAYIGGFSGEANGMNGMAVSPNWLYMYDGITLKQLVKNTGALNNSTVLPGTTSFEWGGLDVDLCDDIYVGNQTNVLLYNSSLTQTGTIGPFTGNVYDVVLGNGVLSAQDSTLYVCGNGFLSSVKLATPNSATIAKSRTLSCSCNCTATGIVSFCGSPYGGPATYSWSNGQTTQTATGLCPGNTYTLTITLGCSNVVRDTFNFPAGGSLNVTTSSTAATCIALGSGTATGSGGVNPYTYSWSGGQTTSTVSGLSAGTYTVTVSDNTGCSSTSAVVVTSSSSYNVVILAVTNVPCFGGTTGSAMVATTSVGNPPFTYLWSPSGGTGARGTGMSAGTYTVTVTDNNGCTATALATITQPPAITGTTTVTAATCGNTNGSSTVTAGGGTSPYTYSWSAGGQTNSNATGLSAGTYTVTITDNNGCTQTSTGIITSSSSLTATISGSTGALCNGGSSGTATVTAASGASPYTYSWASAGGTGATGTGLSIGSYTVTVTDNGGCTATAIVTITQPPAITATTTVTAASCGNSNGSATVTAGGGTSPYTYSWSPGGQTNSNTTGLSSGTYTVTITDNNGCTQTTTAIITGASGLVVAANTRSNDSCNGGSNGSAVALITLTGLGPYTYSWSPAGGTSSTGTGMSAGTYTVTVTDNGGCTATAIVTITQPTAITVSVTAASATCGMSNGSATATAGGGTSPYTYSWSPGGQTGSNATALSAGTFTITITDNNGCTSTSAAIITSTSSLTATITNSTGVSCNGGSDGTATVTAASGVSPYTYAWALAGGTGATGTGLSAGTYTVTVTDNGGCTATALVTITQPALLTATMGTANNVLCNGASTGSAAVTAGGGISPYTYAWTISGGSTATGTGLSAGAYTVTITDNNGCTTASTVTITQSAAATLTTSSTPATCGGSNGSGTVTVAGGTSPYTYSWSAGGQTNTTATGLSTGIYTITVTDNNGCSQTTTATVNSSSGLTATISSSTNVLCNGGTNGSATVTATGGSSPYTYSWSPGGQTSSTATGFSAGTYTVTVTDNTGCVAITSVTITQPASLTATIGTVNNPTCNGRNNGSATVTAGGGTSSYNYSWSPSGGTRSTARTLSAGTYTVTVTDNNGCTATASVTITDPPALTESITTLTNIPCNGGTTGLATTTASGGTSPYTYSWRPSGGNGATISGMSAGTYSVLVTDNNGCTATAIATITQPPAMTLTLSTTSISCYGTNNGSITSTVAGGTSPYTYIWSPSGGNGATASNLGVGTYTLNLSDANGCTVTASATITAPTQLSVSASGPGSICSGANASLTSSVSGGTLPYNYSWSSGGTTANITVNPASTTTYTLVITDAHGCTATATVTVTTNSPLNVILSGAATLCPGDSAILSATASGGDGIYTFLWLPGNGTTTSIIANPSTTTIYTVELTDACGSAMAEDTATVSVHPLPKVNFEALISSGCVPLCVQFKDLSTVAGGSITQWQWSFGREDTTSTKDPIYCYPDTGTYSVVLTVTSNAGCLNTLVKTDMITVYPLPKADFTYSPQPIGILSPTVQFTSTSSAKYPVISWYWNFGDGADSISYLTNPQHTYSDTGTYCVTLVVENRTGCMDSVTNCLIVEPDFTLYIPNTFTPNADGLNETFMPKGSFIKNYDMYIFDRWEAQIFHSNEITTGWNGRVNGVGTVCQEGTYLYLINITDTRGKLHSYTGMVNLIK